MTSSTRNEDSLREEDAASDLSVRRMPHDSEAAPTIPPPLTSTHSPMAREATAVQELEVSAAGQVLVRTKSSMSVDGGDSSSDHTHRPPPTDSRGPATTPPSSSTSSITSASNLRDPSRRIWIVTTAALPWRTGTAVNPLLRALTLAQPPRPKHYVTLMVPWLPSAAQRRTLYGKATDGESDTDDESIVPTQQDQEEWIRNYCRERCGCDPETVDALRIWFYEGSYQESFGSIFPTKDICSLIPLEEADVAILEEPEHLNWFRVPDASDNEKVYLGWAHMFRHVVGILHTNYAEYVREYSMGASLITAPALNSLSSLVVRAYCHRVIRLSATLPSLCDKEVTSNVHGVRPEFLETPVLPARGRDDDDSEVSYAPVYFIGKVIWAKGFDKVLELQERFKEETGEYFRMDVYGTGNDEAAIQRACFGRKQTPSEPGGASGAPLLRDPADPEASLRNGSYLPLAASDVFGKTESLRHLLRTKDDEETGHMSLPHTTNQAHSRVIANASEWTEEESDVTSSNADVDETPYSSDLEGNMNIEEPMSPTDKGAIAAALENPVLSILSDVSEKAICTGVETAGATATLIESAMAAMFNRKPKHHAKQSPSKKKTTRLNLVPLRARYKWRTTPLPARFMGTKDHILLRDIPEHSIFLNMSTTEVLCTTSAEALAMGKYVILPRHPSNEFFYQFPNCLAYDDLDDCVSKLQYALSHRPEHLMQKHVHMLSWEGATERLFEAAAITEAEEALRVESGMMDRDLKAARFHVDGASKSLIVKNMLTGGGLLSKRNSSTSLPEEASAKSD